MNCEPQDQGLLDERRRLLHELLRHDISPPPCGPLSDASLCSQPEAMDAAATSMLSPQAAPTPQDKVNDPFLYFSSDKRRMEHLLGKELPSMPSEEPTRRKKRISFELNPFFLMMTSFPELFDDTDEEEKEEYREA